MSVVFMTYRVSISKWRFVSVYRDVTLHNV